jgi:hypothetical protein
MTQIVAAEFDDFAAANAAVDALRGQGFPSSHLTKFFLTAPGQHAQYPLGGDTLADPGSEGAAPAAVKGAAVGSATGLALGLAAAAVAAAAGGIAAGAYAGSLAGAAQELGGEGKDKQTEGGTDDDAHAKAPKARPAGVVVAVNVPTPDERERATSIFWRHRANSIELAEGTWNNGTWQDFNPQSIPHWRKSPAP